VAGIVVNDVQGTTVEVDVFLEYRIADPVKARFSVSDWEGALTNVVSHAVISILGTLQLQEILCDRTDLREDLEREIADETARWGIKIERVFLRDVRIHPEVAQYLLRSVAAKLERWKADIEEEGRQRAALLGAETSEKVASLIAEARSQYPLAVGRAYAALEHTPTVREAYDALYELSLLHPHRTISFVGFEPGEIRAMDAAMLPMDDHPIRPV
jgi:regulator of protease activity HflC (stomatin/prohibitin superfamily)